MAPRALTACCHSRPASRRPEHDRSLDVLALVVGRVRAGADVDERRLDAAAGVENELMQSDTRSRSRDSSTSPRVRERHRADLVVPAAAARWGIRRRGDSTPACVSRSRM